MCARPLAETLILAGDVFYVHAVFFLFADSEKGMVFFDAFNFRYNK